jgi:predicted ATP-grasp superfamily ATP-dependent carboligase
VLAESFEFALPAAETVENLVSKVTLDGLAQKMGWHAPVTRLLGSLEDAEDAASKLRFPAVLKPPVKSSAWIAFTKQKCIRVNTPAEFLTTYKAACHTADVLVLQEWVPGKEYWTANCYYDRNHNLLVNYVSQKLRQWPIETGTGCSGVAKRNPEVAAFIEDMFRDAGFHGQAYIEVKRDPRDGRYILIEPNIGRSTGRSVMAEADGLELLLTQYNDLTNRPTQRYLDQPEPGVKWVYWRRELRVLAALWRRREITMRDWWRSIKGRRIAAVFDWRDPVPFVLHWVSGIGKLLPGRQRRTRTPGQLPTEPSHDQSQVPSVP